MKYTYKEVREDRWLPIAIKKEGIRRVAKEAGLDKGFVSKIVNGKLVCSNKTRMRLALAVSDLRRKDA